jgi:CheY-like chemotaxis protein
MCLILIAEDHADIRETVAEYLAEIGHDVQQAADGFEALDRLRSHRPCVLLLDLRMPRMDGWELLSVFRGDPTLVTIPVIVLSAEVDPRRPLPVLPAAAFWPKPLDFALLASIGEYCSVHPRRT